MSATIYRCVGIVLAFSAPASVQTSLPAGADEAIAGLVLGDAESARALIGDFRPETIGYGFSHYRFANRDRTEVMVLVQPPGAEEFAISQVRVRAVAAEESLPFFPDRPPHFVTALGVHVGATKEEVKAVLGVPKTETDDKLLYRLTKETAPSWLASRNMPEYRAVYQFRNGRLVDFEFGFPYP